MAVSRTTPYRRPTGSGPARWAGIATLGVVLLAAGVLAPPPADAQEIVTMGTGSVLGVYYPVGGAICRTVNPHMPYHKLRCLVDSTAGSLDNVRKLAEAQLTFGLVQSDVQWQAAQGKPPFERAYPELRSVLALYPETLVLALRADAPIRGVGELSRARLNLGPPGSGTRAVADTALGVLGLAADDLAGTSELGVAQVVPALAEGQIDGFLMLVGHPSPLLDTLARTQGLRLLPLAGAGRDEVVRRSPYYSATEIPGGLYAGLPDPVPTFGVMATLMTHEDVSERVVYGVAKSVLLDLEQFRQTHPALRRLTRERLMDGISAPVHPGACAALREAGVSCTP